MLHTWLNLVTPVQLYVGIGLLMFAIGLVGFLVRRSGIVALMCLELMLNGTNLCFVTFSTVHGNTHGSSMVLFVVLVAAAEAALALSILVALFRKLGSVYLDDFRELRG
jgi:NADH-quinone oxidoreductase subunit K